MKVINYSQKSSNLDVAGFLDPTPLYISVLFRKDSKIFKRYAQKQWCYKGIPWNNYSKTSQDIIQSWVFLKNKIANKRENQSAADIVADVQNTGNSTKQRFLLLTYVQILKLFKTLYFSHTVRHLHLSPTTFKKTKKQFHRLLLHILNMKWAIGFRIVNGIIVISILQIHDTEFDWSFL